MNPWRGLESLPREVWLLCLATLVNRAGTMVLPFLTLYLTVSRELSPGTAGLALTVYGVSAIIIAPIAGRLSDRFGGLTIMKLSLVLSGSILFLFPFVKSITGIFILCGVWSMAGEAFRPPSMATIGEWGGPERRKAAFALNRLAINLGMSIGPVVGGFLAMRSFNLLFYVDGTTSLLAGLLLVLLPWRTSMLSTHSTSQPAGSIGRGTREPRSLFKCLKRSALHLFPGGDVAGGADLFSIARGHAVVSGARSKDD